VVIKNRRAEGNYDRLPVLVPDLVRRQVAVIIAMGTPVVFAAKAATSTIPIVFGGGIDPVQAGLVASLHRPGGNITGVTSMNAEIETKRLGLLHELLPRATGVPEKVALEQLDRFAKEVMPAFKEAKAPQPMLVR
jgi:putative ABC transport system substrate-binding protein